MRFSLYSISKEQTYAIKGLAMLILVLHNFFVWTNDLGVNEMDFDPNRIFRLGDMISQNSSYFFNGISTYFGFYAITPFIFFSAYGLTKKYANEGIASYWQCILLPIKKVYGLLIFGLTLFLLFFWNVMNTDVDKIKMVASILSMTNNFSRDTVFAYQGLGPWWFFSLIVQLYILFPFLFKMVDKFGTRGFFVFLGFAYALIFFIASINKGTMLIFCNSLGHLPEFTLGILLAKRKDIFFNWGMFAAIIVLFILSNFYYRAYPFTYVTSAILSIAFSCFVLKQKSRIFNIFVFLGQLSMFMFVINGPLRLYTIRLVESVDNEYHILSVALLHTLIVVIAAFFMSIIYKKVSKWIGTSYYLQR